MTSYGVPGPYGIPQEGGGELFAMGGTQSGTDPGWLPSTPRGQNLMLEEGHPEGPGHEDSWIYHGSTGKASSTTTMSIGLLDECYMVGTCVDPGAVRQD